MEKSALFKLLKDNNCCQQKKNNITWFKRDAAWQIHTSIYE